MNPFSISVFSTRYIMVSVSVTSVSRIGVIPQYKLSCLLTISFCVSAITLTGGLCFEIRFAVFPDSVKVAIAAAFTRSASSQVIRARFS